MKVNVDVVISKSHIPQNMDGIITHLKVKCSVFSPTDQLMKHTVAPPN